MARSCLIVNLSTIAHPRKCIQCISIKQSEPKTVELRPRFKLVCTHIMTCITIFISELPNRDMKHSKLKNAYIVAYHVLKLELNTTHLDDITEFDGLNGTTELETLNCHWFSMILIYFHRLCIRFSPHYEAWCKYPYEFGISRRMSMDNRVCFLWFNPQNNDLNWWTTNNNMMLLVHFRSCQSFPS